MALLNLNTLLAAHNVRARRFMRAKVEIPDRNNFTHIFSDTHLTLTRSNPVEADENGVFDLCYVMDGEYCVHLYTASDRFLTRLDIRLIAGANGNGYLHRFEALPQLSEDTSLSYGPQKGRIQVAAGDYVKINDTSQTYRVAPPEADDAQVATQGGVRFYINQNRYDIKAEAWGVKMSGADEDAASNARQMQAAIDWLSREGGGRVTLASEGHMKIDHAIRLRPGVIVDGAGTLTDNILVRQGSPGDKFGQDATYLTGGFAKTDHNEHVWHALDAVVVGADFVTLSSAADAAAYEIGDIVWIVEAHGTWGDGQHAQPLQSELARVAGKSGGVLKIEFHNTLSNDIAAGAGTIALNPTGAWIANVDWRVASSKAGGDWPDARFILKDASLVNHRLTQSGQDGTQNTAIFGTRSGVYNCCVENIECHGKVANLLFGNGYANSRYHNIRGPYFRRAIEIKYLSQNSIFSDLHMWKVNHGFDGDFDEDPPISIGEDSHGVIIDTPRIDVGNWKGNGSGLNLISFTTTTDCELRNPQITGQAAFASAIGFPNATRCAVVGGSISVPTSVTIEDDGTDCSVRDVTFLGPVSTFGYRRGSTARGGRITGNTWLHEVEARTLDLSGSADRAVVLADNHGLLRIDNTVGRRILASGNLNKTWEAILCSGARDNDVLGEGTSSTVEVPLGDSVTISAGTLEAGDIFEWTVSGECTGTAGPRRLSWRAAIDTNGNGLPLDGSDDANEGGNIEIPATCSDWVLKAKAIVTHSNRMVTQCELVDLTAGTTLGAIIRHVGAQFATSDTIFTLAGSVADANDMLIVRTIERRVQRPGFLS